MHLIHDQRVPLGQLARHQYALVQRLALRIVELRDKTSKSAFQQLVLDGGWVLEASAMHAFHFDPACYPVLSDLEDGKEEWLCAVAINAHTLVKRWVRNLDSDPVAAFWLPTSSGRFYPDFVCELTDGRLWVAEYKGEHLRTMAKEIEKGQVGRVWAERSGGTAVFSLLFKQDWGMGLAQQIDAALVGAGVV